MDERLALIEQEKQNALNQSNNTYNEMLQNNQNLYNQQNAYANTYEKTQNETLDKQLAYQQELINQQKETARQNMETESKKAKNDYTAYNNPYGYQAESMASRGLLNSGVSETAKLGSFNTYQNRLATANKAMQNAFIQYDNDMNEARLNNNVQKAQNAVNKLQMQLQYTENFYNNKNTITQNQLSSSQALDSEYYNRYQTEYNNIQTEKQRQEQIRQWEAEMAEQQRQYEAQMAYQQEQDALAQANWERELAEKQRQYDANLAYQKELDAREQANWEREYALSKKTTNNTSGGSYETLTDSESTNITDSKTTKTTKNTFGNNSATMAKSDYYFKSTTGEDYQPRYINNARLSKTGITAGDLGIAGIGKNKNIWTANGKYYVWKNNQYYDVTEEYKKSTSNLAGGSGGGRGF